MTTSNSSVQAVAVAAHSCSVLCLSNVSDVLHSDPVCELACCALRQLVLVVRAVRLQLRAHSVLLSNKAYTRSNILLQLS
jgi:hypothetical protein